MYILYTDNRLLFGTSKSVTDKVIADLIGANLDLTVDGDITDFLGMSIKVKGNTLNLTQPLLTK